MRIISGDLRGRQWKVTSSTNFRPTCDRIREAIFNILGDAVRGARAADVFCGQGGFGLEALSRGAAHACFIDSDRRAMRDLQEIVAQWGLRERSRILAGPAERMLLKLPAPADIMFADPPFFYPGWPAVLAAAARGLAPDGLLITEVSSREPFAAGPHWQVQDTRDYGDATVRFLRRCRGESAPVTAGA